MSPCTAGWVLRDSKMGQKGVECRDCHDPHGNDHWAELKRPDNALCLTCHATDASGRYATPEKILAHTRHGADSPGSLCAECHMPRIKRFSDGIHVMSAHLPGHEFSVPTGGDGRHPLVVHVCHTTATATDPTRPEGLARRHDPAEVRARGAGPPRRGPGTRRRLRRPRRRSHPNHPAAAATLGSLREVGGN
jgi:predicted CXXCH cytochrome family protein